MRIRQILITATIAAGLVAAAGGYLYAWQTDDYFVGSVWMIVGIAAMSSGVIYSLAMDDVESRTTALTTNRHHTIDLRDPVDAPVETREDTRTTVRV